MIDIAKISVKAGNGGNGCISFRREKFVPKGGPDGGDGGNGGNVYLWGDSSLNTLLHLKYHSTWRAKRGNHGGGKKKRGANGDDTKIPVPIGTVVWRLSNDEKEFAADLTSSEPVLVARGGAGGFGNKRFVSSVHKEPVLAQSGEEGEDVILLLELKLLADVGLIGQPNAGKSTLLSASSAARPKIAPYAFTTIDPALGVVITRDRSFVMMEIPGLVEGAHRGVGLGHEFLRHAERSRLFLHILDGVSEDPLRDWLRVNNELTSFNESLGNKPQIVVVNKVDITEVRERLPEIKSSLEAQGALVFAISAATGEGIDALLGKTLEMVNALPVEEPKVERREATLAPRGEQSFKISQQNGTYVIRAPKVERLLPMANLKDWRAQGQIWRELQRLGVVRALEEEGVQPGDRVLLGKVELEWF